MNRNRKLLIFTSISVGFASTLVAGLIFLKQTRVAETKLPQAKNASAGSPETVSVQPQSTVLSIVQETKSNSSNLTTPNNNPQKPLVKSGGNDKEYLDSDGKEILDAKTELPPVGEMIGTRPDALDMRPNGPAVELLNLAKNRLLSTPNILNSNGPVVSPETK
jgi:hypothetical protein